MNTDKNLCACVRLETVFEPDNDGSSAESRGGGGGNGRLR